jgi:hypothetical protein
MTEHEKCTSFDVLVMIARKVAQALQICYTAARAEFLRDLSVARLKIKRGWHTRQACVP